MRTIKQITLFSCLAFSSFCFSEEPKPIPVRELIEQLSRKVGHNQSLLQQCINQQQAQTKSLKPALKKAARRGWPLSARFVTVGLTALLLATHGDELKAKLKEYLANFQKALEKPVAQDAKTNTSAEKNN